MHRSAVPLLVIALTSLAGRAAWGQDGAGASSVIEHPVTLTPDRLVVDPKTNTVTVVLTNTTSYGLTVIPYVSYGLPRTSAQLNRAAVDSVFADSLRRDSLTTDSLGKQRSLVTWITDLPREIPLAPNATYTVTVHVSMPPSLTRGITYSAHLYVSASAFIPVAGMSDVQLPGGGVGKPMTLQEIDPDPERAATIVYNAPLASKSAGGQR